MPLHTQYRPKTLDKLIGHAEAVTRMKGIINSGKVPSAILLTGPTSVGKTTLARAFACDLSGRGEAFLNSPDYREINFSDTRGIDDIRELIKLTRFKPQTSKYRVIVGDECQGVLSTPAAANCIEADTLIVTNKGKLSACEIYNRMENGEEFLFLSFNHKTGELEWKRVLSKKKQQSTKNEVTLTNGAKVTSDHKVYTKEKDYTKAVTCDGLTGLIVDLSIP